MNTAAQSSKERRSKAYKQQSKTSLCQIHKRLSTKVIRRLFRDNDYHFTATYHALQWINVEVSSHQEIVNRFPILHDVKRIILETDRIDEDISITSITLLQEIDKIDSLKEAHVARELPANIGVSQLLEEAAHPVVRHVINVAEDEDDQTPLLVDDRKPPPIDDRKPPPLGQVVDWIDDRDDDDEDDRKLPAVRHDAPVESQEEDKENHLPSYNEVGPVASMPAKLTKLAVKVECGCCFGDFFLNEIVECEGGHSFCAECLRSYVQEQIFTSSIVCMSVDGCKSAFSNFLVDSILPTPTRTQRNEQVWRAEIQQANIEDLVACPRCPQAYEIDSSIKVVCCPGCTHKFCRKCHEEPHGKKTCDEAKEERDRLNELNTIADKMTNAVVRQCPNCALPFIKEDGCNKMKCRRCKTRSCYLCRKVVKDYRHFCQTPHCKHRDCGMCVLFTDTVVDDNRARREAGTEAGAEDVGLLSPEREQTLAIQVTPEELPTIQQRQPRDPHEQDIVAQAQALFRHHPRRIRTPGQRRGRAERNRRNARVTPPNPARNDPQNINQRQNRDPPAGLRPPQQDCVVS